MGGGESTEWQVTLHADCQTHIALTPTPTQHTPVTHHVHTGTFNLTHFTLPSHPALIPHHSNSGHTSRLQPFPHERQIPVGHTVLSGHKWALMTSTNSNARSMPVTFTYMWSACPTGINLSCGRGFSCSLMVNHSILTVYSLLYLILHQEPPHILPYTHPPSFLTSHPTYLYPWSSYSCTVATHTHTTTPSCTPDVCF